MNIFLEKAKELLNKVKQTKATKEYALPSGAWFLNEDEIVCVDRPFGDGRYPYASNGLNVWAHSSGNIDVCESTFNWFLETIEGKEPCMAFYFGEKRGTGYFPISITGAGKLPFEENVDRFTVFTSDAVYYFAETENIVACQRIFVDENKNIRFSQMLENKKNTETETYSSTYLNPFLRHGNYEYIETKWYKKCAVIENGFSVGTTEYLGRNNCLKHVATIVRSKVDRQVYSTTARSDFMGGMSNQLTSSKPLQTGKFEQCKPYTEFNDTAVAGDIIPLTLQAGECFVVSYTMGLKTNDETPLVVEAETEALDKILYRKKASDDVGENIPTLTMKGFEKSVLQETTFAYFLKNVFRQVEFCARAKNYAGPLIGIRDIFQQLEASLMWIPEYSRGKIVEALNYIGENGRPPRQYSYPPNAQTLPEMDLRPFIDQGVWIITTVYTYLTFTGDFSILKEECGYYKIEGNSVDFSDCRDSVLEHLIRIADYLVRNIDENTHCLHALYGDWNDALDGLGRTNKINQEYGNGVSVMATLQLYKNLEELSDILERVGGYENKILEYTAVRKAMQQGILENTVVSNGEYRKILHGWGDDKSFTVGGFHDNDGESRDGLTAAAYFVISDALQLDPSLKEDILKTYERLDSKYGLKTFEPHFGDNPLVGRITHLPKGTAENGAVYIHGTLFGIWSLFKMGEAERAWEQLYKILPITHEFISTTPFVMPNSYICNEEKMFDGESMSDWFTGSGCVLIKTLIWYVFGIRPTLDFVKVEMADYLPFSQAEITLNVKGGKIKLRYEKAGKGVREYFVDGKKTERVLLSAETMQGKTVEVLVRD